MALAVGRGIVMRHTAAAVPQLAVGGLGVKTPLLLAAVSVKCYDFCIGRADVERVANLCGRALVFGAFARNITGAESPGDLELVHVFGRDLLKRCIARATRCAAVVYPALLLGLGGVHSWCSRHIGSVADHAMLLEHGNTAPDHGNQQHHCRAIGGPTAHGLQRSGNQRQYKAQHHPGCKPRHQRPEGGADLPVGPDQGADKGDGKNAKCRGIAPPQQNARNQQQCASHDVVPGAAQHGQLRTHTQQYQADQCQHQGEQGGKPAP